MLKGDMTMRKLIIPIQFIMIMGFLAFNVYAEQSKERMNYIDSRLKQFSK